MGDWFRFFWGRLWLVLLWSVMQVSFASECLGPEMLDMKKRDELKLFFCVRLWLVLLWLVLWVSLLSFWKVDIGQKKICEREWGHNALRRSPQLKLLVIQQVTLNLSNYFRTSFECWFYLFNSKKLKDTEETVPKSGWGGLNIVIPLPDKKCGGGDVSPLSHTKRHLCTK